MDQYFEMMKTDRKSWKLKVILTEKMKIQVSNLLVVCQVFQRMCESCIHWSKEINEITKDERVAEQLRPSHKVYRQLVPEINRVFDELAEPIDENAGRARIS